MRVTAETIRIFHNAAIMITASKRGAGEIVWDEDQTRAGLEAVFAALALPQPAVAKADEERAREFDFYAPHREGAGEERIQRLTRAFAAVRAETEDHWFSRLEGLRDAMAATYGWDIIASISTALRQVRP